ncbi:MAG TPA: GGDEF domain-containing protein [Pirellulales bacterium]|nr:GGDEF domain-containing protein [Pirellulales bacterium]
MFWLVLGGAVNLSLAGVLLYLILMRLRPTDAAPPPASLPTTANGEAPPAAKAAKQPRETPKSDKSKATEHEQRRRWLDNLTTRVEGEIGLHSYRIEEISEELRGVAGGDPEMVLAAAARILVANQRLQADLASARAEIQQQRQQVEELVAEARTDTLTGLPNRRSFNEDLQRRFDQWRRHQMPLALIMLDLDHFKRFNDSFGHQAGDAVLRLAAQAISNTLRQMDLPARFGGEEFAVVLPGTKLREAMKVAERVRAMVAAQHFEYDGQPLQVTVSVGVAPAVEGDEPAHLIERADEALYAAKERGRNCALAHDGEQIIAIEQDHAAVRLPFTELQRVAPYGGGGELPDEAAFHEVRCHDLSAGGISFLCAEPPDSQSLVVQLGKGPNVRYMIARVAHIVAVGESAEARFRVGCSFIERLHPPGLPAAEPELVAAGEPA